MKKDQMPGRRSVLRIAACFGAAATAGLLFTDREATPGKAAVPGKAAHPGKAALPGEGGVAGAAGGPRAAAGPPVKASAYRLQPMTAATPQRYRRALPPVRRRPFDRLSGVGRTMVLTFDDGPDRRYTPGILSTLREYKVPAVFFVCGEMATDNRDLLRQMADDGHVVGNHSWSHPLITKLPPSGIRDELGRTSEVIEQALGAPPLWYRAPYGAWNRLSFEIGAELGMEPLAWTLDTLDWTEPGVQPIVGRVLEGAAPGVVVLSHDAGGDRSQSVAALRRYLPQLLESGYRFTVPRR
ncbi:polysaccharide deacetylase family protein [Streptomyces sp. NBC_00210]|uniref:polysaccharide deacetylase family protein n=1 Tax=unclassified Streptomyces TaxID=2593676 RepID=UPI0032507146